MTKRLITIVGATIFFSENIKCVVHMSIELTRKIFSHSEKEWNILNETIRQTVFESFAKGDFPGLIFTYMCAFDLHSEFDYLEGVINLFKANGANCYVVELCADFDERLAR